MIQFEEEEQKKKNLMKPLKKIPALHEMSSYNQIYIRGNRPYPVYVKHSQKVLKKHNTLIIHALTSAINNAVKLALQLMQEYPYLTQQVFTDSVPTINQYEGNKMQIKQRSAIHIVLKSELKFEKEQMIKNQM